MGRGSRSRARASRPPAATPRWRSPCPTSTPTVAELADRGITFESYESPATDAAGIATIGPGRAAWFKDPAGNLLAVIEFDEPL